MKVLFRADASVEIGSGHVVRCLSLANALRARGASCRFFCREYAGNLIELVRGQGYDVVTLPAEQHSNLDWRIDAEFTKRLIGEDIVDWLVVDHYGIDSSWESSMRSVCRRVMVIDDLADRVHDCDFLLDQNLVLDMEERYRDKVPSGCGLALGPGYALLQPDYAQLHMSAMARHAPVRRILIYFGGADSRNLTGMAIDAVLALGRNDVALDVVINACSPHAESVRCQASGHEQITVHGSLPTLAPLMVAADLAVGAGGSTSWERCCLGLPAVIVTLAENQRAIAAALDQNGLARWLGHLGDVDEAGMMRALKDILDDERLSDWSERCRQLVDGKGTQRVCEILQFGPDAHMSARLVRDDDEAMLLRLANDPVVRQNSFSRERIGAETHHAWFSRRLRDHENCRFYVVETETGASVGQVRFERSGHEWEVHFAMDAVFRGRGAGGAFLRTALCEFVRSAPGSTIIGRVRPENTASRKLFCELGFDETKKGSELCYRRTFD